MSKRKADFDTPEKENKRPKMLAPRLPSDHITTNGRMAIPGYDMMLSQRPCSATIAFSLSVQISSLRVAAFLKMNL